MSLPHFHVSCDLLGSFSNEDGDGGGEALKKMCLYFTSECRNCVNLFSTPVGLKTSAG